MLSKFSRFLTIAALTTLTCVITHPSSAQPETSEMGEEIEIVTVPLTINQLVNEAFWENSGDFFRTSQYGRTTKYYFWLA